MYFEAHFLSASLQMSLMSLPDKLRVKSPSSWRSSSDSYLAYLLKMRALVLESGNSNLMLRSILEMRAGSKSFFLLVAQITSTSPSLSKLSIFLKRVDKILLVASWRPDSLLVASESISSMKRMTLPRD